MNFDRTFCTGLRCNKKNTCDRWLELLKVQAVKEGLDLENRRISIAEFGDENGNCDMYSPIEDVVGGHGEGGL